MYLDMDWEKLKSPGTQQLQYFVTRLDKGLKYVHGIGMSHSFRLVCNKVFCEIDFLQEGSTSGSSGELWNTVLYVC